MRFEPLPGFQHFCTHHCVTGSLRHMYVHNGHPLSEEMLLGLGAGAGLAYWHFKGQPPFLGGRGGFKPPLAVHQRMIEPMYYWSKSGK